MNSTNNLTKGQKGSALHDINEWKHMEEVAYWKSLATSLYYEKKMLENHLRDVYVELINKKDRKDVRCSECTVIKENKAQNKPEGRMNYSVAKNLNEKSVCTNIPKKVKTNMNTDPMETFITLPPFDHGLLFRTHGVHLKSENFSRNNASGYDNNENIPFWCKPKEKPKKVMNFSQSHNVKRKSQHVNNSEDVSKSYVPNPVFKNRSDEMNVLYGTHKSQIAGVETALQLNFERARNQLKPSFWPELQLNLG